MDGFDTSSQVIVIAATNRPEVLDEAILRPGRFDRRIQVETPDKIGREQILKVHLNNKGLPLGKDVRVEGIASATTGLTGADLANVVNEAAIFAARQKKKTVDRLQFDQAILRVTVGVEKKRPLLGAVEKEVVAKHEVGHALVGTALTRFLKMQAPVNKLSIIPLVGGALGYTYTPPNQEDRSLLFDDEIRGRLALLMGGRAAEELTCE